MKQYKVMRNKFNYYKVQWRREHTEEIPGVHNEWRDLFDCKLYSNLGEAIDRMNHERSEDNRLFKRANNDWEDVGYG